MPISNMTTVGNRKGWREDDEHDNEKGKSPRNKIQGTKIQDLRTGDVDFFFVSFFLFFLSLSFEVFL